MSEDRKIVLLRAALELLKKRDEGRYIEDVYILMEDIANELEEIPKGTPRERA
jgi:hypothetical protein